MSIILKEIWAKNLITTIHTLSHLPSLQIKELSKKNQVIFYNALMINHILHYTLLSWLFDGIIHIISYIGNLYILFLSALSTIKNNPSYINLIKLTNLDDFLKISDFYKNNSTFPETLTEQETNFLSCIFVNITIDMLYYITHQWFRLLLFINHSKYLNFTQIMWNNLANVMLIIGMNIYKKFLIIPNDIIVISLISIFINTLVLNIIDFVRFNNNKKRIEEKLSAIQHVKFVYNQENKTLYVNKNDINGVQILIMHVMLNK